MSTAHLRLSDGRSWAWEFTASGPDQLAAGCLEAWAQCPLRPLPYALELHVRDPEARPPYWAPAGCSSARIVRRPDTATERHNWTTADWSELWETVRTTAARLRELELFFGAASGFAAGAIDGIER